MNTLRVVFHCGLLLMLISMAALAQSVQTDYDRSFNLAKLVQRFVKHQGGKK